MVGDNDRDGPREPDGGDQHWMAGYEGPWFSGLACPTCGALVGYREEYAVRHRRWHEAADARVAQ